MLLRSRRACQTRTRPARLMLATGDEELREAHDPRRLSSWRTSDELLLKQLLAWEDSAPRIEEGATFRSCHPSGSLRRPARMLRCGNPGQYPSTSDWYGVMIEGGIVNVTAKWLSCPIVARWWFSSASPLGGERAVECYSLMRSANCLGSKSVTAMLTVQKSRV
jgi:hypothetical protein